MLRFDISHQYKGMGISKGLDRGLLVYDADKLLVEEGMGIGACAVQTGGFTYFTSIRHIIKDGDSFKTVCSIDKRLEWVVLGFRSKLFTRIQEYFSTNIYMRYEKIQTGLLKIGEFLGKVFNGRMCFVEVQSLGEIKITYVVGDNEIVVDLSGEISNDNFKLYVMNELGGNVFDKAIVKGEMLQPPSGWQKLDGPGELYSELHSLAFTLDERHISDNVRSQLYWGRELIRNICWAGFENELVCESGKFEHYKYAIKFRRVLK
jgi:hypothetical protein